MVKGLGHLGLALLLATTPVQGTELQSRDSIRDTAKRFARQQLDEEALRQVVKIKPGRLDPRLRLARCDQPLQAFFPSGARRMGNTTVGVRCNGSTPWTLYVPVTIEVYARVVVAAAPLAKGEILDGSKVRLAEYNLAKLPQGYFHQLSKVMGMRLRRNLRMGQPLVPAMVQAPRLVERGQRVILVAGGNGLDVRMPGEALSHGARGDRIRVRNLSSRRIVEGVVTDDGLVRVSP